MRRLLFIIILSLAYNVCYCQDIAEKYMSNPSFALKDAESYFQTGDYEKSIKIINIYSSLSGKHDGDELLSNAKSCIELWNKIELYEKENNLESVKQCCDQILAINSQDQNARNKLESCIMDKGRGIANGHEWVDLGLSVKWATCNIGANSPEEYGNYFAWDEISSYEAREDKGDSYVLTQVNQVKEKWGGNWRLPTKEEYQELIDNCSWTLTTKKGINGYEVKSNKNGNTIFFPFTGYTVASGTTQAGNSAHYWSSSTIEDYSYFLYLGQTRKELSKRSKAMLISLTVRPVYSPSCSCEIIITRTRKYRR